MTLTHRASRAQPGAVLGDLMLERTAGEEPEIRWRDGTSAPLPVARWLATPTEEELALLDRVRGPVLDVGCGPGRHVAELHRRDIAALGIDVLPEAIQRAQARGAKALRRSVFGRVPDAGTWRTALLLDGNVGIGGDPVALLHRIGALLAPRGRVLLEAEPAGIGLTAADGRIATSRGRSARFTWGRVGVDGLPELGHATGFATTDVWSAGGRWFAELARTT